MTSLSFDLADDTKAVEHKTCKAGSISTQQADDKTFIAKTVSFHFNGHHHTDLLLSGTAHIMIILLLYVLVFSFC